MRQDFIESIINQRAPLAEKITQSREKLSRVLSRFEEFSRLCQKYNKELNSGTDSDSENIAELFKTVNSSEHIINEGSWLMADLHNIAARLSRRTLNIAVIGRARQGKSRLLQTITGLSTQEIPDGNLAFCTGVRSDIINDPSAGEAYAVVNFLTERRFINENVVPYFEEFQKKYGFSNLFPPSSVAEFKSLTIPEPGMLKARPEDITQVNLHLEHLKDLQENLSRYQEYLDKPPLRISREQIREYVAQDNEKGERVFFKYAAVDRVEIFCKFPNTDVKALRLIDLPGLGDTRIGDVQRVVSALSDQVDLVFFLSKPSNSGAAWQDNEIHLYSQARKALGEKLPIERWSFWVFNHDSRPGAENIPQCELLQKSMSAFQIKVSDSVIVDCTSPDEVSQKLIDKALEFLAANIERNDLEYAKNLQELLSKLLSDIKDITDKAMWLLRDDSNLERDSRKFDNLFGRLWKDLQADIQDTVGENSELRNRRDDDCIPFKEKIMEILRAAEELEITSKYTRYIKKEKSSSGGLQTAYEGAMHQLRTGLSSQLQENLDATLNAVLLEMKDKICEILADTGRLEKAFGVRDHRLLNEITNFLDKSDFKDDVPAIVEGFNLLCGYSMNYRSFIQHRLRSSLNKLDPLDPASHEYVTPLNIDDSVTLLEALYHETINEIHRAFADIYSEPNKAAFAVAEEFKDIVIRSSSESDRMLVNQWRTFYRSIRGRVWPEEYGASQRRNELCTALRAPLSEIASLLNNNFTFGR